MFKKRESIDILDIPELHRRNLIKLPETEKQEETQITKEGFFDFSQSKETNINQTLNKTNQSEQTTSFLSDFASIGFTEQLSNNLSNQTKKEDFENVKDLKWRIENLEFKLEQLIEKVNSTSK